MRDPEQPARVDAAEEAIELAAAQWIVLQDAGLDPAQQRVFERWLGADSRHAPAHARLKETWHDLDRVPAARVPLPSAPAARGRSGFWLAGSMAAAAALAIGFTLSYSIRSQAAAPHRRAVTPIGGFESLALADGSVIRLNTATEVAVDFSASERRVTLLRGEASFEVAKDAARPFVVRAGEVDVRAVGTVFNVRQSDRAIEVLVMEGKVKVDNLASRRAAVARPGAGGEAVTPGPEGATVPLLTAGQRATIMRPSADVPTQATVADLAPAESARALAWHSRHLEFSNEPLVNIAAEFNRYNRHRLVIEDSELGTQRFGGKFPADDLPAFVRVLELNFGVVAERHQNETRLRRAPAGR